MRTLTLLVILTFALAGCTAGTGPHGSDPAGLAERSTGPAIAGMSGPQTLALPAVADLDRLASFTDEELLGFGIVALGPGAEPDIRQFMSKDTLYGVDLEVLPGEQVSWVIQRSPNGPYRNDPSINWIRASSDPVHEVEGPLYCAVADWASVRWHFVDVSENIGSGADGYDQSCPLDGIGDPVSPAGYVYLVTLSAGQEGAENRANNGPGVTFEITDPYLAAPLIDSAVWHTSPARVEITIDAFTSPDGIYEGQWSTVGIYRCQGETWDPETAEKILSGWGVKKDESATQDIAWTYNLRFELSGSPAVQPGLWGEPVTVLPPEV